MSGGQECVYQENAIARVERAIAVVDRSIEMPEAEFG